MAHCRFGDALSTELSGNHLELIVIGPDWPCHAIVFVHAGGWSAAASQRYHTRMYSDTVTQWGQWMSIHVRISSRRIVTLPLGHDAVFLPLGEAGGDTLKADRDEPASGVTVSRQSVAEFRLSKLRKPRAWRASRSQWQGWSRRRSPPSRCRGRRRSTRNSSISSRNAVMRRPACWRSVQAAGIRIVRQSYGVAHRSRPSWMPQRALRHSLPPIGPASRSVPSGRCRPGERQWARRPGAFWSDTDYVTNDRAFHSDLLDFLFIWAYAASEQTRESARDRGDWQA